MYQVCAFFKPDHETPASGFMQNDDGAISSYVARYISSDFPDESSAMRAIRECLNNWDSEEQYPDAFILFNYRNMHSTTIVVEEIKNKRSYELTLV